MTKAYNIFMIDSTDIQNRQLLSTKLLNIHKNLIQEII